jgi:hypothetical protein
LPFVSLFLALLHALALLCLSLCFIYLLSLSFPALTHNTSSSFSFPSVSSSGAFGTINYKDIMKFIALGDEDFLRAMHDDSTDPLDDNVTSGIWGASPIVDLQLSTNETEEAKLNRDGYERVLARNDVPGEKLPSFLPSFKTLTLFLSF